jgi:hypothetical protein
MNDTQAKKPRRLNIAALLNILLAILSLGALFFLAWDPDIREKIQIDRFAIWTSTILASLLLVSSIAVLLSIRSSHFFMLGAAALFYGAFIVQNAWLLQSADLVFNAGDETKLWGNIVRKMLTLALTVWATLSGPSRAYFAGRRVPSSLFKNA